MSERTWRDDARDHAYGRIKELEAENERLSTDVGYHAACQMRYRVALEKIKRDIEINSGCGTVALQSETYRIATEVLGEKGTDESEKPASLFSIRGLRPGISGDLSSEEYVERLREGRDGEPDTDGVVREKGEQGL